MSVKSCPRLHSPWSLHSQRYSPGDSHLRCGVEGVLLAGNISGPVLLSRTKRRSTTLPQLSDKVTLTVSEGHPQAVLTLQPAWAQIFIGETVTLSCEVVGGALLAGGLNRQERSNAVNLTVSNRRVFLQTPPQPVFDGDTLTLRCRVWSYTATRVAFYKDNEELQSQADTELSVDRVSKSDEGSYKCRAEWWDSTYSGVSAQVRVSVRGGFILTERDLTPSLSVMSHRYIHTGVYSSCVNVTLQRCGCQ
ncbi:low affinity immunoglobulin gamma Fc region receptor II-like [Huso huso]